MSGGSWHPTITGPQCHSPLTHGTFPTRAKNRKRRGCVAHSGLEHGFVKGINRTASWKAFQQEKRQRENLWTGRLRER